MAGGDPEWAASLRADEMRDWARWTPEPRTSVDRGALPPADVVPEQHEAQADQ